LITIDAEEQKMAMTAARIRSVAHQTRAFRGLPDSEGAAGLLAELATAPCRFAPVPADRPVALYGAGNLGRLARDFLKLVGHAPVMMIDRDAERLADDPEWSGVRVAHPREMVDADVRVAVSIATAPYVPVEESLLERGFDDVVPFYDLAESFRHRHPLSNGWFAPPLTAEDKTNADEVLALWHDDISRAHHLQFVAWRRLREEWTFASAPVVHGHRYFIPEVSAVLHDAEFLIDAGAHHGGVTEAFARRTNGRFRGIVAVEPDSSNRAKLAGVIERMFAGDRRITILDCALAEDEGEAVFHEGLGYASRLSPTGRTRVATRRLDALGIAPTFLKLHLEGGELAALQGARDTLLAHRPIVATTVYHNADGVWRTPLWLMQTLPDYRFLFRLDAWCGTGAVVYAIPNERGP
jgi:FkbM family methyltransferase